MASKFYKWWCWDQSVWNNFQRRKKNLSEILTTSCCHQLLGPTLYRFSQASKGLTFQWNAREGGLHQQVLLQRAMSHLPAEAEAERSSASKRQAFRFWSKKPTPSVLHMRPTQKEQLWCQHQEKLNGDQINNPHTFLVDQMTKNPSAMPFRSLIHFEITFVYSVRECSDFILLHVVVQFSQHHLLKTVSFLHCIFLPALS